MMKKSIILIVLLSKIIKKIYVINQFQKKLELYTYDFTRMNSNISLYNLLNIL